MRSELMITAFLVAYREVKGPKACRKIVGSMRKNLAPKIVAIAGGEVPPEIVEEQAASALMAAHCRACRGCRLGRE